ncbi:MAG TPA: glycoside hydrolase family 127 protein, partial [Ktedonobacteraceae bacterium]|nr:glycoside hydrolase family 127 protein [Ktedonobacteraceae bacterium]
MDTSTFSHPNQTPEQQRRSLPVAHTAVTIDDILWSPFLQKIREQTLFRIYEIFEQEGYFAYDKWASGVKGTPFVFWESDISKWLEA